MLRDTQTQVTIQKTPPPPGTPAIISNIRTQQVISNTPLHTLGTDLGKPPRLQTDPDLDQTKIALADPPQHGARVRTAQLPQDGQRGLEQVEPRVQTAPDAFEQEDGDDDVDEVALHADVVCAHHAEHLGEHVADADVAEREGLALDPQDEMLHFQREDLAAHHRVGLATPPDHEVAGLVAVELGHGAEQVEEVAAVGAVQLGDQARVDEDELGPVALGVDLAERGVPVGLGVGVGPEPGEDGLDLVDVAGVGGLGGLLAGDVGGDFGLVGLVEAHHDVARVEVGVHEVVDQEHVQEGVEAFVGDFGVEDPAAAGLEEGRQRDALGEFFDQDLSGRVVRVGVGEPGGRAGLEVFAENAEIGALDPQVELETHHGAEVGHFVGQVEPLEGGDGVDDGGEDAHDLEIAAHDAFDFGMEDFDGDVGRRDALRRRLDQSVDVAAHTLAEVLL